MKCPFCESEMIHMNDFSLEDRNLDDEKGIISVFECSNNKCNCEAEFIWREDNE
jgi:hypothetical protein